MSVEHTTQLIQLILNSALMVLGCALLLGRVVQRQEAIETYLINLKQRCETQASPLDNSLRIRKQLRSLQQRFQLLQRGATSAYAALLGAIASTFLLALRALLPFEFLIPVSLVCFTFGVAALLVAVCCMLLDLHHAQRSLMEELREIVGVRRKHESGRESRFDSLGVKSQRKSATTRSLLRTKAG
jgi:hypothetical protein